MPHRVVVDTLRDAHVDDSSFMSCPCSNTALGCSAVRVVVPHGTLHCFTGVQRVRCPCNGMVCSHSSMVVSGQEPAMYAENLYGQWVCTHCPNGATVQKRAARGTSTLLARGTGCGRPLV